MKIEEEFYFRLFDKNGNHAYKQLSERMHGSYETAYKDALLTVEKNNNIEYFKVEKRFKIRRERG